MEGLPNRKQRRMWAKQAGYFQKRKEATYEERAEMTRRSIETGHQIHLANTERILREEQDRQDMIKTEKIQKLIESGLSQEDALKQVNESYE